MDLCIHHKLKINTFEKEQNHGGQRGDCFSLLYLGNLQRYCFSNVMLNAFFAFQT